MTAMPDEEKTEHDEPEERPLQPDVLELPLSGLVVQEGVLYRRTNKGTVMGRHPLEEISEVRVGRTLDRFALVMTGAFAGTRDRWPAPR
jgi:hypothetical protein